MIVVFSHSHPSVSKGGAEVSAYTLFKGLRQLGQAATFVAMCPQDQLARVRVESADELLLPYQPAHYDHFFHFADPGLAQQAIQALAPLRPTALVFHHFLFLGINTIRDIVRHFSVPSALVLHEFLAICHHHGQMVTRPAKRLCSQASPTRCHACFPEHAPEELHVRKTQFLDIMAELNRLISPSHFLARRFADWGAPEEKILVVENGLSGYDPASDRPAPAPHSKARFAAKLRLAAKPAAARDGKVVFGYFGQINPFKGIDLILDALDELAQHHGAKERITVRVHGNIVGVDDRFRQRFESAASDNGMLEYVGPYDNADVITLMQRCDYILMASKWWENSPVVIQEAYAANRPVIAPQLGGMAEKVIDGISGRLFSPNCQADLARIMRECTEATPTYAPPQPISAAQMASTYLQALMA